MMMMMMMMMIIGKVSLAGFREISQSQQRRRSSSGMHMQTNEVARKVVHLKYEREVLGEY